MKPRIFKEKRLIYLGYKIKGEGRNCNYILVPSNYFTSGLRVEDFHGLYTLCFRVDMTDIGKVLVGLLWLWYSGLYLSGEVGLRWNLLFLYPFVKCVLLWNLGNSTCLLPSYFHLSTSFYCFIHEFALLFSFYTHSCQCTWPIPNPGLWVPWLPRLQRSSVLYHWPSLPVTLWTCH